MVTCLQALCMVSRPPPALAPGSGGAVAPRGSWGWRVCVFLAPLPGSSHRDSGPCLGAWEWLPVGQQAGGRGGPARGSQGPRAIS